MVFINYRREDTGGQARLILEALQERLGETAVFMDVDSIEPGAIWPERIRSALSSAETVVAVIGKEWLHIRDDDGRRRIDLEIDWVRIELEMALTTGKRVIPVYVRDAEPLRKGAFPPSIQDLAERKGICMRLNHWKHDLALLLDLFSPSMPVAGPDPALHFKPDRKLRTDFLEQVAKDVTNRLASSVHSARFLDLEVQHDPNAVASMWAYRDPNTKTEFPSLEAAFEASQRRLLLLGHPGSGKTTALLHLAELLIQRAREDEEAPVPFFVNLSKYNRPTTAPDNADSDRRFEDWLAEEMSAVPEMEKDEAKRWIASGRVAALLDGLDEFNDDRRPELAHLINVSFLRRHLSMVVVICSRTNDYQLLRGTENSIQLNDSVELLPLRETQIIDYLRAAKAEGLGEAILADPNLAELAKTPLTLSMLALAYGGLPADKMPRALSLTESRNKLFEAYVDRRLQREARRKAGRQMNDSRDDDVPLKFYRYRPEQVYRWLGILATVLSQRMTTVFSVDHFYLLLMSNGISGDPKIWLNSIRFAWGVWLSILALLATGPVLFRSLEGLAWTPVVVATCMAAAWLSCRKHDASSRFFRNPKEPNSILPYHYDNDDLQIILFIISSIGIISLGHLAARISGDTPPAAFTIIAAITFFFLLFVSHLIENDEPSDAFQYALIFAVTLVCSGFSGWIVWQHPEWGWEPIGIVTAGFIALSGFGFFLLYSLKENTKYTRRSRRGRVIDTSRVITGTVGGTALFYLTCGSLYFSSLAAREPGFKLSLIALTAAIVCISKITITNLPATLAFVTIAAAAGAVSGKPGLALGTAAFLTPFTRYLLPFESSGEEWLARLHRRLLSWLRVKLLSPCVWFAWSIARAFPLHKSPFLDFCGQIHLLKKSNLGNTEFIHRLLRDYFALCQLQPLVERLDGTGRLDAIRALGFQGEAALDPLIEIAEQGTGSDRAAALEALSHIPSPSVSKELERYLDDTRREVRVSLVKSIFRLHHDTSARLIDQMIPLGDGCEIEPLLKGLRIVRPDEFTLGFQQKWGDPGRQALLLLINHSDQMVYHWTYHLLGGMKVLEAVPALLQVIQRSDRDHDRIEEAIKALHKIGDRSAVIPLTELLKRSKLGPSTLPLVIQVLDDWDESGAIPAILRRLKKGNKPRGILQSASMIVRLGSDSEILSLAALWPKVRPKETSNLLPELDDWLQIVRQSRQVPSARPIFRAHLVID